MDSKLQSAMEYMMTYGWALLIIAVVLVALVALNIFSPSTGSNCIPTTGFTCTSSGLSYTTGGLIATLSSVSNNYPSAEIAFAPQGTQQSAVPNLFTSGSEYSIPGGLQAGVPVTVNVPVANGGTSIGASYSGQLWVQYMEPQVPGYLYAEIATVSLKASGSGGALLSSSTTLPAASTSSISSTSSTSSISSISSTSSSTTSSSTSSSTSLSTSTSSTTTTTIPSVSYGYNSNWVDSAASTESLTLASGYGEYFCSIYEYDSTTMPTVSFTVDQQESGPNEDYPAGFVGHTSSNVCTISGMSGTIPVAMAGIGISPATYTLVNHGTIESSPSFDYSVSSSGVYTIVIIASLDPDGATVPSGCTEVTGASSGDTAAAAYIYVCSGQATGSYTVSTSGDGAWAVYQT